jgi:hypothetical protein
MATGVTPTLEVYAVCGASKGSFTRSVKPSSFDEFLNTI